MWQKKVRQVAIQLLQAGFQTNHNRVILLGAGAILSYLLVWFSILMLRSFHGSASGMLQIAAIYLGVQQLWQQRQQLRRYAANEEDQLLGSVLIISGVLLFPICLITTWAQPMSALIMAMVCAIVLGGIVCAQWGLNFFKAYPIPTFVICLGLLPKPAEITRAIWQSFTAPELLERFMAWAGSEGLNAIGQPATANGIVISLPGGSVEVGWGCNGFDMAMTMAVASFILGLFLKQRLPKIILLMLIGASLALISNIPRIMLMTIASVYWGKYWFDFWHNSWGSQILVSVIFTIYYYIIMGLVKKRTHKPMPE